MDVAGLEVSETTLIASATYSRGLSPRRRRTIALCTGKGGRRLDTFVDVLDKLLKYMQTLFAFVDKHQTGMIVTLMFAVFILFLRRRR